MESRPRVGSTFRVRFPRRSIVAATLELPRPTDSRASRAEENLVARVEIAIPATVSGLTQKGKG